MALSSLRGVIAAVPTPVTPEGEPDIARFMQHASWALANGCDALNVLGTTGEANSFSADQRKEVMSAAALVLPPYYYKGISDDGLFAWFERLITATRARSGPIYLYNFPQLTGVPFSVEFARRLKTAFPDRIAGAKDSSGDLAYASRLAEIPDFDVFPSSETSIAKAASERYAGCISASVSVTAPLVGRFWADPQNGVLAAKVAEARTAIAAYPLVSSVKHLTAVIHGDPSFERVLPPHLALTESPKCRRRRSPGRSTSRGYYDPFHASLSWLSALPSCAAIASAACDNCRRRGTSSPSRMPPSRDPSSGTPTIVPALIWSAMPSGV